MDNPFKLYPDFDHQVSMAALTQGGGAVGVPRHVYRESHNGNGEKDEPVGTHHAGCMVVGSQIAIIYCFRGRYLSGFGR